jgi:hypothetical protein
MPATCKIENCSAQVEAKGWCKSHYNRWLRHGDPLAGRKPPYRYIGDGRSKLSLHRNYEAMRKRCGNAPGYENVKVCERWLNNFWAFAVDMGPKPSPQHTLDRYPDPFGDYEPGNCRWALPDVQARNRHTNLFIVAFGKSKIVTDWAKETGFTRRTISRRLKEGWVAEDALSIPPKKRFGL